MNLKEKTQLIRAVLRQSDQVGKVFACLVYEVNMKTNVFLPAGVNTRHSNHSSWKWWCCVTVAYLRQHSHWRHNINAADVQMFIINNEGEDDNQ